jgi:hypothetical protein
MQGSFISKFLDSFSSPSDLQDKDNITRTLIVSQVCTVFPSNLEFVTIYDIDFRVTD